VQKNLFGLPLALKAGRQEIVLDGHRLFGHTGWTTGAQSHDAIAFWHKEGKHTIAFIFSKAFENAAKGDANKFAGTSADDSTDVDHYIFYGKQQWNANQGTSVYFVLTDNDSVGGTSSDFYTIGLRHAGKGVVNFRIEGYQQFGKSGIQDPTNPGQEGDRGGNMFGVRVGKQFGNVGWKPKFTLWADYLSGTEIDDAASGDRNSFNTLFDTGHKFYGFMDFFLGEQAQGLIDLAVKVAVSPAAKTTIKLDLHHFQRAEEATVDGPTTLGQEVDLTVVYKYSANMKMVAGYSRFFAREVFAALASQTAAQFDAGYNDADWAYLMMDMKF
jgi:hypothetical protein